MKKTILAIDHGTLSGFCVYEYEDGRVKTLDKGFFIELSGMNLSEIYDVYYPVFKKYAKVLNVVCVEKVNLMGTKFNGNAVIRLAEIRSIIKLLAGEHRLCQGREELIVEEVNPTSMKKFLTENGRAGKQDVAEAICYMFDLNIKEVVPKLHTKKPCYDMVDAMALGYYTICKLYNKGEHLYEVK